MPSARAEQHLFNSIALTHPHAQFMVVEIMAEMKDVAAFPMVYNCIAAPFQVPPPPPPPPPHSPHCLRTASALPPPAACRRRTRHRRLAAAPRTDRWPPQEGSCCRSKKDSGSGGGETWRARALDAGWTNPFQ